MMLPAKLLLYFTLVLAPTLALPSIASAQQRPLEDVVYLKDGSIIRGTIIEQVPGESILIETADRNVFRYTMDQIARIAKEPISARNGVVSEKSPVAAWAWSFAFPGAGQLYNGRIGRGFLQMGTYYGSFLAATLITADCGANFDRYPDCSAYRPMAAGLYLLAVADWVWAQVDAPLTAKAINEGRLGLHVQPRAHGSALGRGQTKGDQQLMIDIGLSVPLP